MAASGNAKLTEEKKLQDALKSMQASAAALENMQKGVEAQSTGYTSFEFLKPKYDYAASPVSTKLAEFKKDDVAALQVSDEKKQPATQATVDKLQEIYDELNTEMKTVSQQLLNPISLDAAKKQWEDKVANSAKQIEKLGDTESESIKKTLTAKAKELEKRGGELLLSQVQACQQALDKQKQNNQSLFNRIIAAGHLHYNQTAKLGKAQFALPELFGDVYKEPPEAKTHALIKAKSQDEPEEEFLKRLAHIQKPGIYFFRHDADGKELPVKYGITIDKEMTIKPIFPIPKNGTMLEAYAKGLHLLALRGCTSYEIKYEKGSNSLQTKSALKELKQLIELSRQIPISTTIDTKTGNPAPKCMSPSLDPEVVSHLAKMYQTVINRDNNRWGVTKWLCSKMPEDRFDIVKQIVEESGFDLIKKEVQKLAQSQQQKVAVTDNELKSEIARDLKAMQDPIHDQHSNQIKQEITNKLADPKTNKYTMMCNESKRLGMRAEKLAKMYGRVENQIQNLESLNNDPAKNQFVEDQKKELSKLVDEMKKEFAYLEAHEEFWKVEVKSGNIEKPRFTLESTDLKVRSGLAHLLDGFRTPNVPGFTKEIASLKESIDEKLENPSLNVIKPQSP